MSLSDTQGSSPAGRDDDFRLLSGCHLDLSERERERSAAIISPVFPREIGNGRISSHDQNPPILPTFHFMDDMGG